MQRLRLSDARRDSASGLSVLWEQAFCCEKVPARVIKVTEWQKLFLVVEVA